MHVLLCSLHSICKFLFNYSIKIIVVLTTFSIISILYLLNSVLQPYFMPIYSIILLHLFICNMSHVLEINYLILYIYIYIYNIACYSDLGKMYTMNENYHFPIKLKSQQVTTVPIMPFDLNSNLKSVLHLRYSIVIEAKIRYSIFIIFAQHS